MAIVHLTPLAPVLYLPQTPRPRLKHTQHFQSVRLTYREKFRSDNSQAMATAAPTPDGYGVVFINSNASLTASDYMGLYTLTSYDTLGCASQCDQASGCQAFNMYIERDPSLNASAQSCPDPPSTTNYKCTLWGAPVSVDEATNFGQYQDSFQVVIAGSNGMLTSIYQNQSVHDLLPLTLPSSLQQRRPSSSLRWLRRPHRTWRRHQRSNFLR